MNNNENQQIFKDYTLKIKNKIQPFNINDADMVSDDINNLVILLNWCFLKKNNFFVADFNKRNIFSVCTSYNQLKTNILSKELFFSISDIFININIGSLKTLKFILYQYINNYDELIKDLSHTELCQKVTKESMRNCIGYITQPLEE